MRPMRNAQKISKIEVRGKTFKTLQFGNLRKSPLCRHGGFHVNTVFAGKQVPQA
jgi:hypothetical protein